jgi:hypothetical protein
VPAIVSRGIDFSEVLRRQWLSGASLVELLECAHANRWQELRLLTELPSLIELTWRPASRSFNTRT